MSDIYIINGPNLNLLGTREPDTYGTETLKDIESLLSSKAAHLNLSLKFFQSNIEGELVSQIQEAGNKARGTVINAAAYTHTSVALMDAISAIKIPVIEVHLSNIYAREKFRHTSYIAPVAQGLITGFGSLGYSLALDALFAMLRETD